MKISKFITLMKPEGIRQAILALAEARGTDRTFCPSEVARQLSRDGWRDLMEEVRQEGAKLTAEGLLLVTQRGQPVNAMEAKGPVRFRKPG
jgi:hypothetical protein